MMEKIKLIKWQTVIMGLFLLALVVGTGMIAYTVVQANTSVQEGNGAIDDMMKLHLMEQQKIERGKKVFEGLLKQEKGKKAPAYGTEEYLKHLLDYADQVGKGGKLYQQDPQKWELIDAYAYDYYVRNVMPPIGTPEEELLKQKQSPSDVRIQAGSYNRTGARDYAYTYAGSEYDNPFYKNYNPAYRPFNSTSSPADCTNFVSQALKEGGGIPMVDAWWRSRTDPNDWFYYRKGTDSFDSNNNDQFSWSWTKVNSLYQHIKNRLGKLVSSNPETQIGDIVQIDFNFDGILDHSTIITSYTSTGWPKVTAHTTNRKDQELWKYPGNYYRLHITY